MTDFKYSNANGINEISLTTVLTTVYYGILRYTTADNTTLEKHIF